MACRQRDCFQNEERVLFFTLSRNIRPCRYSYQNQNGPGIFVLFFSISSFRLFASADSEQAESPTWAGGGGLGSWCNVPRYLLCSGGNTAVVARPLSWLLALRHPLFQNLTTFFSRYCVCFTTGVALCNLPSSFSVFLFVWKAGSMDVRFAAFCAFCPFRPPSSTQRCQRRISLLCYSLLFTPFLDFDGQHFPLILRRGTPKYCSSINSRFSCGTLYTLYTLGRCTISLGGHGS